MALDPMQLQMFITAEKAARIPEWTPPGGYALRGYQPGDEVQWSELLLLREFGEWTVERLLEAGLAQPERREGSRLIVYNGEQIVAGAMASQRSAEPPVGALDFIVAHPDHSGKELGYGVCAAVMRYLVERGYPKIVLSTDGWRLPAIKTYLKLGFLPDLCREDMPGRWREACAKIGWPYPCEEEG